MSDDAQPQNMQERRDAATYIVSEYEAGNIERADANSMVLEQFLDIGGAEVIEAALAPFRQMLDDIDKAREARASPQRSQRSERQRGKSRRRAGSDKGSSSSGSESDADGKPGSGLGLERSGLMTPRWPRLSRSGESFEPNWKRQRTQSSPPLALPRSPSRSGQPSSSMAMSTSINSTGPISTQSMRRKGRWPTLAMSPSVSSPNPPPNRSRHPPIGSTATGPTRKQYAGLSLIERISYTNISKNFTSSSEAMQPPLTSVSSVSTEPSGMRSPLAQPSNSPMRPSLPDSVSSTSALTGRDIRQAAARAFRQRVAAAGVVGVTGPEPKSRSHVASGMPTAVCDPKKLVSTSTSAESARGTTSGLTARKRSREEEDEPPHPENKRKMRMTRPRYLRRLLWTQEHTLSSPSATFTEIALPFPRPSAAELANKLVRATVQDRPDLFQIITPLNTSRLQQLLSMHPNQPFVDSLCLSFREGFWPWADTSREPAEITRNYSQPRDWTEAERDFIMATCQEEEEAGRFSPAFGTRLLPGMVCEPVFPIPKAGTDNQLRLITDQSAGLHSLNSLIPEDSRSVRFDNLQDLGSALRHFHRHHGRGPRWLFKSDVSKAYRLLPMHPHWQIRQVLEAPEEGEMQKRVDRCGCFGNAGMVRTFCHFFGAVIWVAINQRSIENLFHYIDDANGFDDSEELAYYPPYAEFYPEKQVKLLELWDELGIPHQKQKQVFGRSLEIVGLQVDVDVMRITMSAERREQLTRGIEEFLGGEGRRRMLVEWQRLAGWMQWAVNAYPLLRPAVTPLYDKMAGKVQKRAYVMINKEVRAALGWFVERLATTEGVSILEAEEWGHDDADLVIYCDASTGAKGQGKPGLGFWVPLRDLGFYADGAIPYPPNLRLNEETGSIFYLEALTVLSSIFWVGTLDTKPRRLLVYTDSMNTVEMFNSMRAEPGYNTILMEAVDALIDMGVSLRVFHIPGEENTVADALSRSMFDIVRAQQPQLQVAIFQPPRLDAGGNAE